MNTSKNLIITKDSRIIEICFTLILFALFLILLIGSVSAASDNFDSGIYTDKWTKSNDVTAESGKVKITHSGIIDYQGLVSKFTLSGDFDVQVDYSGLNFGTCSTSYIYSAIGIGLGGANKWMNIERRYWPNGAATPGIGIANQIFTDFEQTGNNLAADTSTSGKFRIKRVGSTVYFYKSDGTTILKSGIVGTQDVDITLYGRGMCQAIGYFDNLIVNTNFCSTNSECNDDNLYTEDKCINPGQVSSYCDYKTIKCINNIDCGSTGFTGKEFCSSNDVFKNYQESKCIDSGKSSSYCTNNTTPAFLIDCGDTSCGDYGDNYCKNNNVYHLRVCNDKGCSFGTCYNTLSEDEEQVQTCNNGCLNGVCKPECTKDSDCGQGKVCSNNKCFPVECNSNSECGTDAYLNQLSCKNNNVFDKYITYTCNNQGTVNSSCSSLTEDKLKQTCSYGCLNGVCKQPQCTTNANCGPKQICLNNNCVDIICKNNNDCNDNNTHTEDKCINPGTTSSTCQHNNIRCLNNAECGTDAYLNQLSCKNNNVFDKYITYTCLNTGTALSSCTNSTSDKQKLQCTNGCLNGACKNQSSDDECLVDSDCDSKSPSKKYCENGNVFQDIYEPVCNNGQCSYDTTPKLVKTCSSKGCNKGICIGSAPINETETDAGYVSLPPEEDIMNLGTYIIQKTNYDFINQTVKLNPPQVEVKSSVTSNNSFWIVLLIILIVIFLAILLILILNI